jgi:hypothetical protein
MHRQRRLSALLNQTRRARTSQSCSRTQGRESGCQSYPCWSSDDRRGDAPTRRRRGREIRQAASEIQTHCDSQRSKAGGRRATQSRRAGACRATRARQWWAACCRGLTRWSARARPQTQSTHCTGGRRSVGAEGWSNDEKCEWLQWINDSAEQRVGHETYLVMLLMNRIVQHWSVQQTVKCVEQQLVQCETQRELRCERGDRFERRDGGRHSECDPEVIQVVR